MATDLTRISEKARREPELVFTSLYHHICDVDNLRACYDALKPHKAVGVDGVTKEEYGKTKDGHFKVKRRTSRKKLGQSLRKFKDWARKARTVLTKGEMIRAARIRVIGHLNYYAITDNAQRCSDYVYRATYILYKWLNRKSHRKDTSAQFSEALRLLNWPVVTIRKDLNPCRRAEAY